MSRVTVTTDDNTMMLDGVAVTFDAGLDNNIWAIQWYGDTNTGHIEYRDSTPNKDITEFPELPSLTEKHKQEVDKEQKADEDARVKAASNMTYADKRKVEYDILPQFEMIYDDKINDTNLWVEAIQAIKKTYPKP